MISIERHLYRNRIFYNTSYQFDADLSKYNVYLFLGGLNPDDIEFNRFGRFDIPGTTLF